MKKSFARRLIGVLLLVLLVFVAACTDQEGEQELPIDNVTEITDGRTIVVYNGSSDSIDTYADEQTVTATADEVEGKIFICWNKNNVIYTFDKTFSYTVEANCVFKAVYSTSATMRMDAAGGRINVNDQGTVIKGTTSKKLEEKADPIFTVSGTPELSGTLAVSKVLEVSTDLLTGSCTQFIYSWQRGDSATGTFIDIEGANESSYTLTTADYNKYVRVSLTGTNGYDGVVYSAAAGPIVGTSAIGNAVKLEIEEREADTEQRNQYVPAASLSVLNDYYFVLPVPVRKYYTFLGWYDEDTDLQITDGDGNALAVANGGKSLVAKYVENGKVMLTTSRFVNGVAGEKEYTQYYLEDGSVYLTAPVISDRECIAWESKVQYVPITSKPADWEDHYGYYYVWSESGYKPNLSATWDTEAYYAYPEGQGKAVTTKPSDWESKYNLYYVASFTPNTTAFLHGYYRYKLTFERVENKPSDWESAYATYYAYRNDNYYPNASLTWGTEPMYKGIYLPLTTLPDDWNTSYGNYYNAVFTANTSDRWSDDAVYYDFRVNDTVDPKTVTVLFAGMKVRTEIELVAVYREAYRVTVSGGTGGGYYVAEDEVPLRAIVTAGKTFDKWSFTKGDITYYLGVMDGALCLVYVDEYKHTVVKYLDGETVKVKDYYVENDSDAFVGRIYRKEYVLLTEKPSDWEENYALYYKWGDSEYVPADSTWMANTYYALEYVLLKEQSDDWAQTYHLCYKAAVDFIGANDGFTLGEVRGLGVSIEGGCKIKAEFHQIDYVLQYQLNVVVNGNRITDDNPALITALEEMGFYDEDNDGVYIYDQLIHYNDYIEWVELRQVEHYLFNGWQVREGTKPVYMPRPDGGTMVVTGAFSAEKVTIVLNCDSRGRVGIGSTTGAQSGSYGYGEVIRIFVTANPGYQFDKWTDKMGDVIEVGDDKIISSLRSPDKTEETIVYYYAYKIQGGATASDKTIRCNFVEREYDIFYQIYYVYDNEDVTGEEEFSGDFQPLTKNGLEYTLQTTNVQYYRLYNAAAGSVTIEELNAAMKYMGILYTYDSPLTEGEINLANLSTENVNGVYYYKVPVRNELDDRKYILLRTYTGTTGIEYLSETTRTYRSDLLGKSGYVIQASEKAKYNTPGMSIKSAPTANELNMKYIVGSTVYWGFSGWQAVNNGYVNQNLSSFTMPMSTVTVRATYTIYYYTLSLAMSGTGARNVSYVTINDRSPEYYRREEDENAQTLTIPYNSRVVVNYNVATGYAFNQISYTDKLGSTTSIDNNSSFGQTDYENYINFRFSTGVDSTFTFLSGYIPYRLTAYIRVDSENDASSDYLLGANGLAIDRNLTVTIDGNVYYFYRDDRNVMYNATLSTKVDAFKPSETLLSDCYYSFLSWRYVYESQGGYVAYNAPGMPDYNLIVYTTLQISQYDVVVSEQDASEQLFDYGKVDSGVYNVSTPIPNQSNKYNYNTTFDLSYLLPLGYHFVNWTATGKNNMTTVLKESSYFYRNFTKLTAKPGDWDSAFENYYVLTDGKYAQNLISQWDTEKDYYRLDGYFSVPEFPDDRIERKDLYFFCSFDVNNDSTWRAPTEKAFIAELAYIELTQKPADWEENYALYYVEDDEIILNDSATWDPTKHYYYVGLVSLSSKPDDWEYNYQSYYRVSSSNFIYTLTTTEYVTEYYYYQLETISAKPEDWDTNYTKYFIKSGSIYVRNTTNTWDGEREYAQAFACVSLPYSDLNKEERNRSDKYIRVLNKDPIWYDDVFYVTAQYLPLTAKPADWDTHYGSYFVRSGDEYVQNLSSEWDEEETYVYLGYQSLLFRPSNWESEYRSYYRLVAVPDWYEVGETVQKIDLTFYINADVTLKAVFTKDIFTAEIKYAEPLNNVILIRQGTTDPDAIYHSGQISFEYHSKIDISIQPSSIPSGKMIESISVYYKIDGVEFSEVAYVSQLSLTMRPEVSLANYQYLTPKFSTDYNYVSDIYIFVKLSPIQYQISYVLYTNMDTLADLSSANVITLTMSEDGWWCSDKTVQSNNEMKLNVESCECNLFDSIRSAGGAMTGITKHSDTTLRTGVSADFDLLSGSFDDLISYLFTQYAIDENYQMINLKQGEDDIEGYAKWSGLFEEAKALFDSSNNRVSQKINYSVITGGILGITKPFYILPEQGENYYGDLLASLAYLLGYSSEEDFETDANNLAETMKENAAGANTSSATGRVKYDGAIYTENGSFIIPYAIKNELAQTVLVYIVVNSEGEMYAWVSNLDALYAAANNAKDGEENRPVKIYGRCMLFEVERDQALASKFRIGFNTSYTLNNFLSGSDVMSLLTSAQLSDMGGGARTDYLVVNWFLSDITASTTASGIISSYLHSSSGSNLTVYGFILNLFRMEGSSIGFNDYVTSKFSSAYQRNITSLIIPETYKGVNVTKYGYTDNVTHTTYNFASNTQLRTVNAGAYVRSIDTNAFAGCTNLTSVTLPSGLTNIGDYAFNGCSSLSSVNIPATVTGIGEHAFASTALTSVTMATSSGKRTYGANAFINITTLTDVYFDCDTDPMNGTATISSYGLFAGSGNSQTGITLHIGPNVTYVNAELFTNKSGSTFLNGEQHLKNLTIDGEGNNIEIAEAAFRGTGLTSVALTSRVKSIGVSAFRECTALTTVTFSGSTISAVPDSCFFLCVSLETITLPASVATIGDFAFGGTSSLTSVYYTGDGLTSIGKQAFGTGTLGSAEKRAGLKRFMPTTMASEATDTVVIPASVTTIGASCFAHAPIERLVLNGVDLTLGERVFYNLSEYDEQSAGYVATLSYLEYNVSGNITIQVSDNTIEIFDIFACAVATAPSQEGCSVAIGNAVTDVPEGFFMNMTTATTLTLGANIRAIGAGAFAQMTGLTQINYNITYNSAEATTSFSDASANKYFEGSGNNAVVLFSSAVTEIPGYMFSGATGVKTLNFSAAEGNDLTIGGYAFLNTGVTAFDISVTLNSLTLNSSALQGMTSLNSITVSEDTKLLTLRASSLSTAKNYVYSLPGLSSYGASKQIPITVTEGSVTIAYLLGSHVFTVREGSSMIVNSSSFEIGRTDDMLVQGTLTLNIDLSVYGTITVTSGNIIRNGNDIIGGVYTESDLITKNGEGTEYTKLLIMDDIETSSDFDMNRKSLYTVSTGTTLTVATGTKLSISQNFVVNGSLVVNGTLDVSAKNRVTFGSEGIVRLAGGGYKVGEKQYFSEMSRFVYGQKSGLGGIAVCYVASPVATYLQVNAILAEIGYQTFSPDATSPRTLGISGYSEEEISTADKTVITIGGKNYYTLRVKPLTGDGNGTMTNVLFALGSDHGYTEDTLAFVYESDVEVIRDYALAQMLIEPPTEDGRILTGSMDNVEGYVAVYLSDDNVTPQRLASTITAASINGYRLKSDYDTIDLTQLETMVVLGTTFYRITCEHNDYRDADVLFCLNGGSQGYTSDCAYVIQETIESRANDILYQGSWHTSEYLKYVEEAKINVNYNDCDGVGSGINGGELSTREGLTTEMIATLTDLFGENYGAFVDLIQSSYSDSAIYTSGYNSWKELLEDVLRLYSVSYLSDAKGQTINMTKGRIIGLNDLFSTRYIPVVEPHAENVASYYLYIDGHYVPAADNLRTAGEYYEYINNEYVTVSKPISEVTQEEYDAYYVRIMSNQYALCDNLFLTTNSAGYHQYYIRTGSGNDDENFLPVESPTLADLGSYYVKKGSNNYLPAAPELGIYYIDAYGEYVRLTEANKFISEFCFTDYYYVESVDVTYKLAVESKDYYIQGSSFAELFVDFELVTSPRGYNVDQYYKYVNGQYLPAEESDVGTAIDFYILKNRSSAADADHLTAIARVFGYGSSAAFKTYLQSMATAYLANEVGASALTLASRVKYDGAIFIENGSFVLPYYLQSTLSGDVMIVFVITESGAISVWVSDIDAVMDAANMDDVDYGVDLPDVTVYGRSRLFETPVTDSAITVTYQNDASVSDGINISDGYVIVAPVESNTLVGGTRFTLNGDAELLEEFDFAYDDELIVTSGSRITAGYNLVAYKVINLGMIDVREKFVMNKNETVVYHAGDTMTDLSGQTVEVTFDGAILNSDRDNDDCPADRLLFRYGPDTQVKHVNEKLSALVNGFGLYLGTTETQDVYLTELLKDAIYLVQYSGKVLPLYSCTYPGGVFTLSSDIGCYLVFEYDDDAGYGYFACGSCGERIDEVPLSSVLTQQLDGYLTSNNAERSVLRSATDGLPFVIGISSQTKLSDINAILAKVGYTCFIAPAATYTVSKTVAELLGTLMTYVGSKEYYLYPIRPLTSGDFNGYVALSYEVTMDSVVTAKAKTVTGTIVTYYGSLQKAVDGAASGDTILLIGDQQTTPFVISKNLTLDTDGYALEMIVDGTKDVLTDEDKTMITVDNGSTFTFLGMAYSTQSLVLFKVHDGALIIDGICGATVGTVFLVESGSAVASAAALTVRGGVFVGTQFIETAADTVIKNSIFEGTTGIVVRGGDITLEDVQITTSETALTVQTGTDSGSVNLSALHRKTNLISSEIAVNVRSVGPEGVTFRGLEKFPVRIEGVTAGIVHGSRTLTLHSYVDVVASSARDLSGNGYYGALVIREYASIEVNIVIETSTVTFTNKGVARDAILHYNERTDVVPTLQFKSYPSVTGAFAELTTFSGDDNDTDGIFINAKYVFSVYSRQEISDTRAYLIFSSSLEELLQLTYTQNDSPVWDSSKYYASRTLEAVTIGDQDWCSDIHQIASSTGYTLTARYCDCNTLGVILSDGSTDNIHLHSTAQMDGGTIGRFDELAALFVDFMGNYDMDEEGKFVVPESGDVADAYLSFFNQAYDMLASNNSNVLQNVTISEQSGMFVGINRSFVIANNEGNISADYADYLTAVARLFGYKDVDVFTEYCQDLAEEYGINRAQATNADIAGKLRYDGAILTDSNVFILPYAFVNEQQGSKLGAYVFVDLSNGVVSVWISDYQCAVDATGSSGSQLYIYGRCKLFESPKKPDDWERNYDSYYRYINGAYVPNTSVEWIDQTYYYYVYHELTEKPADWDEHYAEYYTLDSMSVYIQNQSDLWQADTYYDGAHNLVSVEPDDWAHAYSDYYIKKDTYIFLGAAITIIDKLVVPEGCVLKSTENITLNADVVVCGKLILTQNVGILLTENVTSVRFRVKEGGTLVLSDTAKTLSSANAYFIIEGRLDVGASLTINLDRDDLSGTDPCHFVTTETSELNIINVPYYDDNNNLQYTKSVLTLQKGTMELGGDVNVDSDCMIVVTNLAKLTLGGTLTNNGSMRFNGAIYIDGGRIETTGTVYFNADAFVTSNGAIVGTSDGSAFIEVYGELVLSDTSTLTLTGMPLNIYNSALAVFKPETTLTADEIYCKGTLIVLTADQTYDLTAEYGSLLILPNDEHYSDRLAAITFVVEESDYFLLEEEPTDWAENYTSYYVAPGEHVAEVDGGPIPSWQGAYGCFLVYADKTGTLAVLDESGDIIGDPIDVAFINYYNMRSSYTSVANTCVSFGYNQSTYDRRYSMGTDISSRREGINFDVRFTDPHAVRWNVQNEYKNHTLIDSPRDEYNTDISSQGHIQYCTVCHQTFGLEEAHSYSGFAASDFVMMTELSNEVRMIRHNCEKCDASVLATYFCQYNTTAADINNYVISSGYHCATISGNDTVESIFSTLVPTTRYDGKTYYFLPMLNDNYMEAYLLISFSSSDVSYESVTDSNFHKKIYTIGDETDKFYTYEYHTYSSAAPTVSLILDYENYFYKESNTYVVVDSPIKGSQSYYGITDTVTLSLIYTRRSGRYYAVSNGTSFSTNTTYYKMIGTNSYTQISLADYYYYDGEQYVQLSAGHALSDDETYVKFTVVTPTESKALSGNCDVADCGRSGPILYYYDEYTTFGDLAAYLAGFTSAGGDSYQVSQSASVLLSTVTQTVVYYETTYYLLPIQSSTNAAPYYLFGQLRSGHNLYYEWTSVEQQQHRGLCDACIMQVSDSFTDHDFNLADTIIKECNYAEEGKEAEIADLLLNKCNDCGNYYIRYIEVTDTADFAALADKISGTGYVLCYPAEYDASSIISQSTGYLTAYRRTGKNRYLVAIAESADPTTAVGYVVIELIHNFSYTYVNNDHHLATCDNVYCDGYSEKESHTDNGIIVTNTTLNPGFIILGYTCADCGEYVPYHFSMDHNDTLTGLSGKLGGLSVVYNGSETLFYRYLLEKANVLETMDLDVTVRNETVSRSYYMVPVTYSDVTCYVLVYFVPHNFTYTTVIDENTPMNGLWTTTHVVTCAGCGYTYTADHVFAENTYEVFYSIDLNSDVLVRVCLDCGQRVIVSRYYNDVTTYGDLKAELEPYGYSYYRESNEITDETSVAVGMFSGKTDYGVSYNDYYLVGVATLENRNECIAYILAKFDHHLAWSDQSGDDEDILVCEICGYSYTTAHEIIHKPFSLEISYVDENEERQTKTYLYDTPGEPFFETVEFSDLFLYDEKILVFHYGDNTTLNDIDQYFVGVRKFTPNFWYMNADEVWVYSYYAAGYISEDNKFGSDGTPISLSNRYFYKGQMYGVISMHQALIEIGYYNGEYTYWSVVLDRYEKEFYTENASFKLLLVYDERVNTEGCFFTYFGEDERVTFTSYTELIMEQCLQGTPNTENVISGQTTSIDYDSDETAEKFLTADNYHDGNGALVFYYNNQTTYADLNQYLVGVLGWTMTPTTTSDHQVYSSITGEKEDEEQKTFYYFPITSLGYALSNDLFSSTLLSTAGFDTYGDYIVIPLYLVSGELLFTSAGRFESHSTLSYQNADPVVYLLAKYKSNAPKYGEFVFLNDDPTGEDEVADIFSYQMLPITPVRPITASTVSFSSTANKPIFQDAGIETDTMDDIFGTFFMKSIINGDESELIYNVDTELTLADLERDMPGYTIYRDGNIGTLTADTYLSTLIMGYLYQYYYSRYEESKELFYLPLAYADEPNVWITNLRVNFVCRVVGEKENCYLQEDRMIHPGYEAYFFGADCNICERSQYTPVTVSGTTRFSDLLRYKSIVDFICNGYNVEAGGTYETIDWGDGTFYDSTTTDPLINDPMVNKMARKYHEFDSMTYGSASDKHDVSLIPVGYITLPDDEEPETSNTYTVYIILDIADVD